MADSTNRCSNGQFEKKDNCLDMTSITVVHVNLSPKNENFEFFLFEFEENSTMIFGKNVRLKPNSCHIN